MRKVALLLLASLGPKTLTANEAGPHGIIVVDIRVNGSRPLPFVLDSGASHCIIDRATADTLALQATTGGDAHGTGLGTVALQHAGVAKLSGNGMTMLVPDLWVLDLSKTPGTPAGLLGFEVFQKYVIQIDGPRHELRFLKSARSGRRSHAISMPLIIREREMFLKVQLKASSHDPLVTHQVRIDTGSGDALIDEEVLHSPDRHSVVLGKGIGKDFIGTAGTIAFLSLGPFQFENVSSASGKPRIGMGILGQFVATFDLKRGRLYLSKP